MAKSEKEFDEFPGSILMTSNCIRKPRKSYKNNIFTTGTVGWPGVSHISKNNLKPLVDKALELLAKREAKLLAQGKDPRAKKKTTRRKKK